MKIDFFHFGNSSYQLAAFQAESLEEALKTLGVEVRHIREESHTIRQELQRCFTDPPHMTLSFGYSPFSRAIGLPHKHILWNHPYQYREAKSHETLVFADKALVSESALFLPQGIREKDIKAPSLDRSGTVLFASCLEGEPIPFPAWVMKNMAKAVSLTGTPEKVFLSLHQGESFLGVELQMVALSIYEKRKERARQEILEIFKEQPLAVYGSGPWKESLRPYPKATCHGPVSASEVIEAMSAYNLVVDPCIDTETISLRLLQGLAAGAFVITYKNPLVFHYFGNDSGVLYFGETLSFDDKERKVLKGQEIVRDHFTWNHIAKGLVDSCPSIL